MAYNYSELLTETTKDIYLFYSSKKATVFDIYIGNYKSCTISFTYIKYYNHLDLAEQIRRRGKREFENL